MSFVPTFRRLFQQRRGWRATGVACVPLATIVVLASLAPAAEPAKLPPAVERKVDFEKDVRPLFVAHCVKCHGAEKQESSLRLDRQEAAFRGGDVGKSIVPGKSAESLLIQAVAGSTDLVTRMPSKGDPLTAEQVGVLRAWIDQGAAWPDDTVAGADPRKHWAFQPPVRPPCPSWPTTRGCATISIASSPRGSRGKERNSRRKPIERRCCGG